MLLDQILQAALLKELGLILLEIANDFGATLDLAVDELSVLPLAASNVANWQALPRSQPKPRRGTTMQARTCRV